MKKIYLVLSLCLLNLFADAQTIPSYVPTNGLVGWWPFNGNANDESGNGNNGTVNGAILTQDRFGNAGKAYSFSSSFIEVLSNNSLNNPQGTVSFWMNSNISTSVMVPIKKNNYQGAINEQFSFALNSPNYLFGVKYYSSCQPGNGWFFAGANYVPLTDGNWHMITATYSATIRIYIDGILISSINAPTPNADICNGNLQFGREWSSYPMYYNGKLDDIAIYNRALTQQEITALYQAQSCSLSISAQPSNKSTTTGSNTNFHVGVSASNCTTPTNYQWQTNTGFGWQTLQNFGQYSGVNTATLNISNVNLSNTNQSFRCIVSTGNLIDTTQTATLTIVNTNNTNLSGVTHAIPYQAVVRDGSGTPLVNHPLTVRCTLHDNSASGNIVYQETHNITTNNLGLFTLHIGTGTASIGNIDSIHWALYKKFLQVEFDTTAQGGNYIDLGTQQFMAVPYALYAETAGNALNGPKGDKGDAGVNGMNGVDGVNGNNGTNGQNGEDGANALVKTSTEPSGSNCQNGGIKIETGLDINKNGILDTIEVQTNQTQYICNGSNATSNGFTHSIGEYYGGGVVINVWKDSTNTEHGTIMALNDIGNGNYYTWGPSIQTTDEYYGAVNCNLALQNNPDPNSAIALCHNYNGGGYTDWYLPARYEMANANLMQVRNTIISKGGQNIMSGFGNANGLNLVNYWTSTSQQYYLYNAYVCYIQLNVYPDGNGSSSFSSEPINGIPLSSNLSKSKTQISAAVRPVRRY
jgi:hypothetical protein